MPRRSRLTALALLCSVASASEAAPTLAAPFTDHAVLQRGKPLTVFGAANPGERIVVRLGERRGSTVADGRGRWSIDLPPLGAGGPHVLEATGNGGAMARARDVMIGDLWLCSGQSNMEYPLSRSLNGAAEVEAANDAAMRLLSVPQRALLDPAKLAAEVKWQLATPATAADFSAACQFMARELRARDKSVAIGLIDATWGGTAIRSWMPVDAVRASGGAADADMLALYRRDPAAAVRRFGEDWGRWWRGQSGDVEGEEPWRRSDRLSWEPLPAFTYWEGWGRADFENYNGGVWARRRVELSAGQAASAATLSLGVIDDADTTFVNGTAIGTTYSWSAPRNYKLPPGVLRAGTNEITVFIRDNWSFGGFQGPAEVIKLGFSGGADLPLGSGWEISKAPARIGEPPQAPWDGQSGVGTLYSGMIAPLGGLRLAGVAWYQGEADVGKPGYDRRLAAMMRGWRTQFGDPRLPFLVVGLAGWGKPVSRPSESGWATLIDEQRRAVAADPAAALVSAIDLGEWNDIHPANKQEVGHRLALAARALVAREPDGRIGPIPQSVLRSGSEVRVTFSKPLQVLGSLEPAGFELCEQEGPCRFARAQVRGSDVVLAGVRAGDSRIRYAWADFPIVNLYDADLLPVPVFELRIAQ